MNSGDNDIRLVMRNSHEQCGAVLVAGGITPRCMANHLPNARTRRVSIEGIPMAIFDRKQADVVRGDLSKLATRYANKATVAIEAGDKSTFAKYDELSALCYRASNDLHVLLAVLRRVDN